MMAGAVALTVMGAVAGSAVASFASVVAYRSPRRESIVQPPSHCETCGANVRPYDNVPIVSWLLLRGRCRDCGAPLPWRAFALEVGGAALGAFLTYRFVS